MPSDLCPRCATLPMSSLLYGPYIGDDQVTRYTVGTLQEVFTKLNCVLCELIKRSIEQYYGQQRSSNTMHQHGEIEVVLYRLPLVANHDPFSPAAPACSIPCQLEIGLSGPNSSNFTRGTVNVEQWSGRQRFMPSIYALNAGHNDRQIGSGRMVHVDKVDWIHIRDWIDSCNDGHYTQGRCDFLSTNSGLQEQLRVIDVRTSCITVLPATALYVALSYEWGMNQSLILREDNRELLSAAGALTSTQAQLSRTIADAITVTRHLAYRYLWVDALCIIQDNSDDQARYISLMDQIYHQADLTIVAAGGQDAEHGIPGVSVARVERQMQAMVQGIAMVNMLEKAADAILLSSWNTRAWTYQERILSRRLLTFTDSQVYFQCKHGCSWAEEEYRPAGQVQERQLDSHAFLDFDIRDIWELYAIGVEQYATRCLTHRSDRLRAFTGFTSLLAQSYRAPFLFGLPTNLFDMGLLWVGNGLCERGDETSPSWSWCGWTGAVRYEDSEAMNNMCECTVCQVDMYTIPGNVQLCAAVTREAESCTNERVNWPWRRCFDEEYGSVSYKHTDPDLGHVKYPRPLADMDSKSMRNAVVAASTKLRVVGNMGAFRLVDCLSNVPDSWRQSCRRGKPIVCRLAVLDERDRWAGTAQVEGNDVSRLQNKRHRFLALSRSTSSRIDLDPSWDADSKTFQHWAKQDSSGLNRVDDFNDADDDSNDSDYQTSRNFFDSKEFESGIWWPTMNVLLLSEADNEGVVERVGIGKIHVTAFYAVAETREILLA